ncbi:MAG: CAP domain-containing protein [Anaerolineae bacterium]
MWCLLTVSTAQAQESSDLLGRINNLRAQRGLPAYTINGALTVAAQQQAQWIIDTGTIAHTHPDGSGPRTRALAAGYPSVQVSENIYGGTNASVDSAWTFWLNSPIHFQGMTSTNYQEIGIGIAHGSWGSSFVTVFGGSGAPPPVANSSQSGGQSSAAAAGPPAYVGGVDEHGNIKHIVQPGDTLGDIALIYGYTWSDLPYMMQLNGLADVRDLEVGSIFLVPPKAGTYTPAPGENTSGDAQPGEAPTSDSSPTDAPAPTDAPPPSALPPTITPFVLPTLPPEIVELTVIVPPIATAGSDVAPPDTESTGTPEALMVAAVPTSEPLRTAGVVTTRSPISTWIWIAVGVQVVVVVGAGIEFLRRTLRRRR